MNFIRKKNILLVDDEAIIAQATKLSLEKYGYSVFTAYSGKEAVEIASSDRDIDLVLMDIDLGKGMDGSQAAEAILTYRDLPLVFLSSHTEQDIVSKTETISSYGYIVKNVGITVIDASIKMAFKLFDSNRMLRNTSRKLEATKHALPDVLFEIETSEEIIDFHSPGSDKYFGFLQEESVIGKKIADVFPPNVVEAIRFSLSERISHSRILTQFSMETYNKETIWYEVSASAKSEVDTFSHCILLCRDISEKKKVELALTEIETRYKIVVEGSLDANIIHQHGFIIFANSSALSMFGAKSENELIGKPILDFVHPNYRELVLNQIAYAKESGNATPLIEIKQVKIDGTFIDTEVKGASIQFNREIAILITIRDISIRKQAEKSMLESELRYRSMIEWSPFPIGVHKNGIVLYMNPSALKLFGAETEVDVVGKPILQFIHPDFHEMVKKRVKSVLEAGELAPLIEETYIKLDGTEMQLEVQGIRIFFGGEYVNLTFLRDITKSKQIEKQLMDSNEFNKKLISSLHDGFSIIDANGIQTEVNQAFTEMTGFTNDELRGVSAPFPYWPPEEEIKINNAFQSVLSKGEGRFELTFLKKNGERFPVVISAVAIRNQMGVIHNFAATVTDISEWKNANARIERLLNEKEVILKEVHHRVKNNMTIMSGLLSLQANSTKNSFAKEALQDASRRFQSMTVLYDKLFNSKDFSDIESTEFLAAIIDEIYSTFPRQKDIQLVKEIDSFQLPASKLQPLSIILNEVLTNIMKHAFNGIEKGNIFFLAKVNGSSLLLSLIDDGIGMPNDIDFNVISGFGLNLVRELTKQLRGTFQIEKYHPQGTRFSFEFPV